MIAEYISNSIAETERIAAEIAAAVKQGDYIAMSGEMGAGKTSFCRGLIGALAPECLGDFHSPTYAIVNEYVSRDLKICHFDFYRLTDIDDLYSTGFYEYLSDDAIIISEWSEMFESEIPSSAIKIKIEKTDGGGRRIVVEDNR